MSQTNGDSSSEKRTLTDRRRRPTPILSRYTFRGRREAVRREADKRRQIYVDRYGTQLFLFLMGILVLGTADGLLTLYHVRVNEAVEMNPIMGYFLGLSPKIFFHVKYILTACCLMILCLHKNLPAVKYILITVFLIYVFIVANHLYLFILVG